MMKMKMTALALLSCVGLTACASGSTGAGSANSNGPTQAPSGITSSNGGGQRALGNIPSVGTTTGGGATATSVPNSKGASY